jgi:lysine biosynthesis protein LysW
MVTCPACEGNIDVDEEEVDEGDTISCDECGAALKVIGTAPLELESKRKKTRMDSLRKRRRMPTRIGSSPLRCVGNQFAFSGIQEAGGSQ